MSLPREISPIKKTTKFTNLSQLTSLNQPKLGKVSPDSASSDEIQSAGKEQAFQIGSIAKPSSMAAVPGLLGKPKLSSAAQAAIGLKFKLSSPATAKPTTSTNSTTSHSAAPASVGLTARSVSTQSIVSTNNTISSQRYDVKSSTQSTAVLSAKAESSIMVPATPVSTTNKTPVHQTPQEYYWYRRSERDLANGMMFGFSEEEEYRKNNVDHPNAEYAGKKEIKKLLQDEAEAETEALAKSMYRISF